MVNEEYVKSFTKKDFLKKGGKISLSLGVGITLLPRKPRLRAVTYFGVKARALACGAPHLTHR